MTRRSISKMNYLIDKNATLFFPTDVVLMGLKKPAVELHGSIVGALNVTVAEGRTFNFDPQARTVPPPPKDPSQETPEISQGIEIGVWKQEANSLLTFIGTGDCNIEASDFVLRSGAALNAKVANLPYSYVSLFIFLLEDFLDLHNVKCF